MERTGSADAIAREVDQARGGLRVFNLVVGLIHLAQAIAMVWLSNDFSLPVTRTFLTGPPGTEPTSDTWFTLALGPAVSAFLFLAAADHLLLAAPGINDWYTRLLKREANYSRWIEYSVSASWMMLLIAMITGVTDIGALIAIFCVNACMLLFGMLMEMVGRPSSGKVNWLPYYFGVFAGAVPWVIVALQIWSAEDNGAQTPGFVYGIIFSLFVLFNTFSINMVLQYKRVGRWQSYVFGEKAYIVLSLIAKTALAWQVFANILID